MKNLSTDPLYTGRVTAPDADYALGSSKNETSPGAGDGTPYELGRANDVLGFQQSLLRSANITPSGNADTMVVCEQGQALVEIASGRAVNYDESGIVNAYELDVRSGQQGPRSYFDGMESIFTVGVSNTLASTADVNNLGVKNIFLNGAALKGGELRTNVKYKLVYSLSNDRQDLHYITTPGEWQTIKQESFAGSSSVEFIGLDNTYDEYKLIFDEVHTNLGGGDNILMELAHAGVVYETTNYDYILTQAAASAMTVGTLTAQTFVILAPCGSVSGESVSGELSFRNVAGTTYQTLFRGEFSGLGPTPADPYLRTINASRSVNSAVTAIRIKPGGSTFDGTITLVGRNK